MGQSQQENATATVGWLGKQWAGSLAQVLESKTGERPTAEWSPPVSEAPSEAPMPDEEILWWEQAFDLVPEPVIWVGLPKQVWSELGTRTLQAAGGEQPETAAARSACLEILSQSFLDLAGTLRGRKSQAVTCKNGGERSDPPPDQEFSSVAVNYSGGSLPAISIAFSRLLFEELESPAEEELVESPAVEAHEETAGSTAEQSAQLALSSKTLDLLLEVDLPVSVSFGRAQMPLQDVLRLTAGSIVELNRSVNEPVELIVNNQVVAIGEVVVIEGNYGVRIQNIVSRAKRLATSKLA
jgi:flagellar motor switch protein FliN/FliY